MQKIVFQKIIVKNKEEELQKLHERLIAKAVRQQLDRRFKEDDYKDVNQVFALGFINNYKLEYKNKQLGTITETQEEQTTYLTFKPCKVSDTKNQQNQKS